MNVSDYQPDGKFTTYQTDSWCDYTNEDDEYLQHQQVNKLNRSVSTTQFKKSIDRDDSLVPSMGLAGITATTLMHIKWGMDPQRSMHCAHCTLISKSRRSFVSNSKIEIKSTKKLYITKDNDLSFTAKK